MAGPLLQGQIISEQGKLPTTIRIASFLHQSDVDSITVNSFGGFTYQLKETAPALYRIQFAYDGYSLFAHPSDAVIRVSITLKNGSITSARTEDNEQDKAYKSFTKMLETFDVGIAQAIERKMLDSLHVKVFQNFSAALDNFATTYKGTFAADSLLPMRRFSLNKDGSMPTVKQFINNFFDRVNFKDTVLLLATPVYGNMIDFYARGLSKHLNTAENKEALTALMAKAKIPAMYKYNAERMFASTVKGEEEEMSVVYVEWMMSKGDSAKLPVQYAKTKELLPSMPGKKIKDVIVGKDSLSTTVSRNKYTLLVFWDSDCAHCRMVMPVVKKMYGEFKAKGFDVFSVALDADSTAPAKYLAEQEAKWVNVSIADQNSPVLSHYFVTQLPILVLINQQGIIEKRFSGIAGIGDYLDKTLK